MKIQFNTISFKEYHKNYQVGENLIKCVFDDNHRIIRREEYDKFDRNICTKWFDKNGLITEILSKDYFKTEDEEGFVEKFKSKTQEYVRKSYTKIEGDLKHSIDDFKSKTGKSYCNDFVLDMFGNLVRVMLNGKVIELRK